MIILCVPRIEYNEKNVNHKCRKFNSELAFKFQTINIIDLFLFI